MGGGDRSSARPLVETLTHRERDILALLAQGHSAPEIAEKLTLAVSSVKWYLRQLYGKLGVNSKRQAVARARELGLVEAATATAPGSHLPRTTGAGSPAIPSAPPAASGSAAQPARKHN